MRRIVLATVLVLAALTVRAQPAECWACPMETCFGKCIGVDCACVVPPENAGEMGGKCYPTRLLPKLVEQGWRVLP